MSEMKGFLANIFSEDDSLVDNIIDQDYKFLATWSCFYPKMNSFNTKSISIAQFLLYITLWLHQIILLIISSFLLDDNLLLKVQTIHYSILFILTLCCFLNAYYFRRVIAKGFKIMFKGIFNYDYETEKYRAIYKIAGKKDRLYFKKLLQIYFLYAGSVATFAPVINLLNNGNSNNYSRNGVSINLPAACWIPYGTDTLATYLIALTVQVFATSGLVAVQIISLIWTVEHSQTVTFEMQMLIKSLELLTERAERYYRTFNTGKNFNITEVKQDKLMSHCYNVCFKQNAKHYEGILSYYCEVRRMLSIPIFLYYFFGTIMIAISASSVLLANGQIISVLCNISLCLYELIVLTTYSWCGEEIKMTSDKLRTALYSTRWYDTDDSSANTLLITGMRTFKPMLLTGAGLFTADFITFTSAIKSAYSYFNLISASASD